MTEYTARLDWTLLAVIAAFGFSAWEHAIGGTILFFVMAAVMVVLIDWLARERGDLLNLMKSFPSMFDKDHHGSQ